MDFTGPESQDWIRNDRKEGGERTTAERRAKAAARFSEGDKIETEDGTRAVVVEVRTSPFTGPDGSDVDASDDSPAYVIATQDGAQAVSAAQLQSSDWSTDAGDPAGDVADEVTGDAEGRLTASVDATLAALPDDWPEYGHDSPPGTLEAGPTDWDFPESWDESETPNRLILLDAWSSMGGQFDCPSGDCCKGTMLKSGMSNRAANQFCASMKDRVLLWEGWRQGG